MEESEYNELVDDLFMSIEDQLDEVELDIDIDTGGSLVTVEFANGSSVVLSRQAANREVWVAAKSGGYHLSYLDGDWFCKTSDESLVGLLNRVFQEQAGVSVTIFE